MKIGELVYYYSRASRRGGAYRAEVLGVAKGRAKIFLIADVWGKLFDPKERSVFDYEKPNGEVVRKYPTTIRTVKVERLQVITDTETIERTRKLREEAYRISTPSNQKTRKRSRRRPNV